MTTDNKPINRETLNENKKKYQKELPRALWKRIIND